MVREGRQIYCLMVVMVCGTVFVCRPTDGRLPIPDDCPEGCWCNEVLLQSNCSYANLNFIPPIHNNTRVLIFDGNLLQIVDKTLLTQLSNLRFLSLAYNGRVEEANGLDEIEENSFRTQRKLVHLDLSGNGFGEVPVALKNLRILKELILRNNRIRTLSKEPWLYLPRLTILALDSNNIPNLPMVMTSNLKKLENFSASHNDITSIPKGQFANTTKLIYLDLSYNRITTESVFSDSFLDAAGSYLPTAATEEEYHVDDTAEGMVVGSFDGLVNLLNLNLAHNNITRLENGIFTDLEKLEELRLDQNSISVIEENVFRVQYELRILILSQNALRELPQKLFEDLRKLEVLKLDSNSILDISCLTNIHMFHLRALYLNFNDIDAVDPRGFKDYKAIEEIYLHGNGLKNVPEVRNLSTLHTLNLRGNRIRRIEPINAFEGTALKILNLDNNRLRSLEAETFTGLHDLRVLRVEGSNYVCDCKMQWILDDYNKFSWLAMGEYSYDNVDYQVTCAMPRLVAGGNLYEGANVVREYRCTEYVEPHRVMLLVSGWGGIVACVVLFFWIYTFFDFRRRFYVRKPRKRYLLLHNFDNHDNIPLTAGEHSKGVRFRSFDSDSESYIYDEETTV